MRKSWRGIGEARERSEIQILLTGIVCIYIWSDVSGLFDDVSIPNLELSSWRWKKALESVERGQDGVALSEPFSPPMTSLNWSPWDLDLESGSARLDPEQTNYRFWRRHLTQLSANPFLFNPPPVQQSSDFRFPMSHFPIFSLSNQP